MSERKLSFVGDRAAVPDTDKLAATIQVDENGLWWKGSKCDLCIYPATILDDGVYYCEAHYHCL